MLVLVSIFSSDRDFLRNTRVKCFAGQVERKRPFRICVPNSGTEGDVVFWAPV